MGKSELTQQLQDAIRQTDWRGAISALDRLARLEPRYAPHRLKMGDYYAKIGETQKAVASYLKAAEIFAGDGFVVKALAAYKIILRLDPGNGKARSGMEGLHTEARGQAKELSVSYPRTPSLAPGPRAGGADAPIVDAWEISKSHFLKEIEKAPGGPSGSASYARESSIQPPPAPAAEQSGGGAPSPSVSEASAPAPPSGEEERLDEGVIGATPSDPEAWTDAAAAEEAPPSRPDSDAEAASPKALPPSGGAGSNVLTLFSSLTKEEFAELTDRMKPYLFMPGSKIVSEGDRGDSVFIVSSGTVEVSVTVGNRQVILTELKDDDFFGEVSFLTGRPRTASIIARTATEILELPGDDLRAVIRKFPRVQSVLEEFHRVRALDTVEKIMPPGEKGRAHAD